jgi:hypothetical protein
MSRAQPHVLQGLMQFIFERKFNDVELPAGWMIVITDNPDNGEYSVSSLDPAQLSRMISVPFNPPTSVEYEQLIAQEVHDDLQSFWTANGEMLAIKAVDVPALEEYKSPRMRMMFNRLYPYIKGDAEVLDFVGTSLFGPGFITTLKSFMSSEQPIRPDEIMADVPYNDRLDRWTIEGRQDLISLSVKRMLNHLRVVDRLSITEFGKLAAFLKRVPKDAGALIITEVANSGSVLHNKLGSMLPRDPELMQIYQQWLTKINKEVKGVSEGDAQ